MPFSADRLARLDSCAGRNPIPVDFDAFWEERMAEADDVPLDYELSASDQLDDFDTCTYHDLRFIGMGGAHLYAKYCVPAAVSGPVPLVLQFHGYPGCTRSWAEQSSWPGLGYAVLSMDNPGQGGRSEDIGGFNGTTVAGHLVAGIDGGPRNLYYVRLYQNQRILCRIAAELEGIDCSRVFVNGGSQGGGMGIACCALNPDLVRGASILYPFLSDFKAVWELGADEIAYEGIRYYSRWFDPDGSRADEWFGTLGYVDSLSFAHLVRCPVLFGTGLADVVCPPETQFAVYNALPCPKRHLLYPDFGHEEIQAFDDSIPAFYQAVCDGTFRGEVDCR